MKILFEIGGNVGKMGDTTNGFTTSGGGGGIRGMKGSLSFVVLRCDNGVVGRGGNSTALQSVTILNGDPVLSDAFGGGTTVGGGGRISPQYRAS